MLRILGNAHDGTREDQSEMIRHRYPRSEAEFRTQERDATATMCSWEVLPSDSHSPIVASGISTDAAKAKLDVEVAMTSPGAGFAHLVRMAIPGLGRGFDERHTWPPLGEVQLCRRNRNGGFTWRALHGTRNDPGRAEAS
ncbi:MAG: hypothetical protein ACRDN0_38315 [Trebonia sp.]